MSQPQFAAHLHRLLCAGANLPGRLNYLCVTKPVARSTQGPSVVCVRPQLLPHLSSPTEVRIGCLFFFAASAGSAHRHGPPGERRLLLPASGPQPGGGDHHLFVPQAAPRAQPDVFVRQTPATAWTAAGQTAAAADPRPLQVHIHTLPRKRHSRKSSIWATTSGCRAT